ncbi:MAG: colanic acid biosynthesis glycosyltransferase WcaL [Methanosarcinales archaeon]|nr:colanic acid biosynthesis glycosyltransferase WcaL [Methanosarcinales archaeon]
MEEKFVNNHKIKVIHSHPVWLPQTQTWMYNQVKYLPKTVESHIVCEITQNLNQFMVPNIHSLHELARWRYYWDKGLRMLRVRQHLGFLTAQIKKHKIQIVHSHFGNIGWADMGAVKKAGIKHIVTFYGVDVNMLPTVDSRWHKRYNNLFKHVDLILCEGPHMAKCLVQLGCPQHKVQVHHLGIRVDEIAFNPRVWNSSKPLRVFIAASFREKKGIPYALEALGHLQHKVPIEITIIGDANSEKRSQDEKQKIMTVIDEYNLQPKIRFLGYQPHTVLFEEAYKHHVFISPSVTSIKGDTEGGAPVTIIEMAATGIPIVSTTHCDIPNVIKDGITGLLAEERDTDGLLKHLLWLVNNPNKWQHMLQTGRKHMEMEFNARAQGEKLAATYSTLL